MGDTSPAAATRCPLSLQRQHSAYCRSQANRPIDYNRRLHLLPVLNLPTA